MHVDVVVLHPAPVVLGVGGDEVIVAHVTVVLHEVSCSVHATCLTKHPPQERQLSSALAYDNIRVERNVQL